MIKTFKKRLKNNKLIFGINAKYKCKKVKSQYYKILDNYQKKRYQLLACCLLNKFMKPTEWKEGHESLLSVFVWYYEIESKSTLKFSKEIREEGFSGSYNYWFLPELVKCKILTHEAGLGLYSLTEKAKKILNKVLKIINKLDQN